MNRRARSRGDGTCLNESPSEKEGKSKRMERDRLEVERLNESPSEKEGKWRTRKASSSVSARGLNESPSEKEGKFPPGMLGASNSETPQ